MTGWLRKLRRWALVACVVLGSFTTGCSFVFVQPLSAEARRAGFNATSECREALGMESSRTHRTRPHSRDVAAEIAEEEAAQARAAALAAEQARAAGEAAQRSVPAGNSTDAGTPR